MTRDLDLLKVDVDLVATVIRLRGASMPTGAHADDAGGDDHPEHEEPSGSSD